MLMLQVITFKIEASPFLEVSHCYFHPCCVLINLYHVYRLRGVAQTGKYVGGVLKSLACLPLDSVAAEG